MTNSGPKRQRQLDRLITDIAGHLMGVSSGDAREAMEWALSQIRDFFGVDQTFLRRNRHEAGTSVLKAEWPKRENVPRPDPLYEVPFDADPIFGMCEDLAETFVTYPEDEPDYQERIKDGSGREQTSMAMVPLRADEVTDGVLGLIRHDNRRWLSEEIRTLGAIASLVAQMWGRHDAEETIIRKAYYDDLTGLPNRRLLEDRIGEVALTVPSSLLMIDVDNMRIVNEGLNYASGDLFLRSMAERLRAAVRPEATVARLEGDQFAVFLTNADPRNVEAMAERLVEELARPYDIAGIPIVRTVSVGIAHDSPAVFNAEMDGFDLLKDAGVAMSEAKKAGKNRLATFDEAMHIRLARDFETEMELRQAIESGEQLCLHYQPEVDLRTGRVVACEALMRWDHPRRGLLTAGSFVQLAEDSGLIVEIGDFVLREAISQLAIWQINHPDMIMRVNVSPAHLMSRDLAGQLRTLVHEFGVTPENLCIEVTEHVMIADHSFTMTILNEVRAMGVMVALDDFGTGYSSMEQLKRLPIDVLKIDRAFMIELATSEKDAAIVDATIRLAEALGMTTVAEGIEEEAQVAQLLNRGCYRAQGFLLARPDAPTVIQRLFDTTITAGELELGTDPVALSLPFALSATGA
ncbi:MAG: EAL domain-containing protein [Actinomycetota bacterium]